MSELVLAINSEEFRAQDIIPDGISGFDLTQVDPQNYAFLPREFADNKSDTAINLGAIFPQILGYFQIVNAEGRILTYQRKGKEKGLLGKWSIGVGGHISQEDLIEVLSETGEDYPDIGQLIYAGSIREIQEELGISAGWIEQLGDYDTFVDSVDRVLFTWEDKTSQVHVGIPMELQLPSGMLEHLALDPSEFNNVAWLSKDELKTCGLEFETWTNLLIDSF